MASDCAAVVTGVGVVSPVGIGLDNLWHALVNRKSGVDVRKEFVDVDQPFRIAAQIHDFEPKKYITPRKAMKVMCRPIQFGFAASNMAVQQANIGDQIDPDRFCTVFGTEAFYADPGETATVFRKCIVNRCYDHDRWGEFSMKEIEPLWMLKYLPNMVASHISILCDARGPSNTICQSESSSLLAVIEAVDLIERGSADAVIVGGTGCLMATTGIIYRGMHRLSRRVREPDRACRPFDRDRDGMVVGEGACAIVLERESFARARNANILGKIHGYSRGFRVREPGFEQAIEQSISESIKRSELQTADIGHVNANGFSTIDDDIYEAIGIANAVQDTPVIVPKGNIGNIGPGTGALELVASLEACRQGLLPPALNIDNQDPRCPIQLVKQDNHRVDLKHAVCLNFSETGQIVSLVVSA